METVAAGQKITCDLVRLTGQLEADHGRIAANVCRRHAGGLEVQRASRFKPRLDQILDDLVLPVDRNRPPAGERSQVDPMAHTAEGDDVTSVEDIPEYAQYVDPQYAQQLMSESLREDEPAPPPRKRPEPETVTEDAEATTL